MKVGVRKPSVKKSISARTTGRVKRTVKRSVNPFYEKKGTGWIKNPERAAKNAIYHRTTVGLSDVVKVSMSGNTTGKTFEGRNSSASSNEVIKSSLPNFIMLIFSVVFLLLGLFVIKEYLIPGIAMFVCSAASLIYYGVLRRFFS
jgi:hypothetical protein